MKTAIFAGLFWVGLMAPVGAQTTSCGMEFGRWVCRPQSGGFDSGQVIQSYQAGQAVAARRQQDRAARQEAAELEYQMARNRQLYEEREAREQAQRNELKAACEKVRDLELANAVGDNGAVVAAYRGYATCIAQ